MTDGYHPGDRRTGEWYDQPAHGEAPLGEGSPADPHAPTGGFAAEPAHFPWPPREDESIPAAFAETWKGSALRPRSFFAALPERASLLPALAYYLPIGIAVSGAELFWGTFRETAAPERDVVIGTAAFEGMTPLVGFLLSPVVLLLSLFISAGITHLLLRLFGGASRGVNATTRIFAFSYSPLILGIVPVVGSVVGYVWMVVVAVIGLREGHRTTTGRAAAAVLIPVAIAIVFLAIAALIAQTGSIMLPRH